MNYLPLANIKGLRRFVIHTAMQPYCFGRLNSIVSGFPTLIEVRRSRKRHCLSAENSMAFAAYKIHFIYWNLFQFFNHHFCGLVNVTATEGNNNISLLSVFQCMLHNLFKGVEPHTAGDFFCKVLCVNSVGVNLA